MKRIALILAAPLALLALHCWNKQRTRTRASDPRLFDPLIACADPAVTSGADEHADEYIHRPSAKAGNNQRKAQHSVSRQAGPGLNSETRDCAKRPHFAPDLATTSLRTAPAPAHP